MSSKEAVFKSGETWIKSMLIVAVISAFRFLVPLPSAVGMALDIISVPLALVVILTGPAIFYRIMNCPDDKKSTDDVESALKAKN